VWARLAAATDDERREIHAAADALIARAERVAARDADEGARGGSSPSAE
jgi:hypothetical protein